MKLTLILCDDGGHAEVTSVDCVNLSEGCGLLRNAIDTALRAIEKVKVSSTDEEAAVSTASLGVPRDCPAWDIIFAIGQMGKSQDPPVAISC